MPLLESLPFPQWHRHQWTRIASLTGRIVAFACRPYDANEVFVTGTFDDWGKTVKLDRVGDSFAKEVDLPTGEKIQYKACNASFLSSLLSSLLPLRTPRTE